MKTTPLLLSLFLFPSFLYADNSFSINRTDQSITIKSNNKEVLVYQLQKPDNKPDKLRSKTRQIPQVRHRALTILTILRIPFVSVVPICLLTTEIGN